MTDQELYEALGIQHFESGGDVNPWGPAWESPEEKERKRLAGFTPERQATAERTPTSLSQFAQYENPGYYTDPTFNPGGAKDKGFNWGIKADDFYKTFGDNPETINGDRDPDGKKLTLASGQKLGVSGRNASMEYTPERDEYYVNGKTFEQYSQEVAPYDPMNPYDSDHGHAPPKQPTIEDWLATGKLTVQKIPPTFHITTDASGILGRDDSGRRLDVYYIKDGDKFVPSQQPEIKDYDNEAAHKWNFVGKAAALVAMAYGAPYLSAPGTAATATTAATAPGVAGAMGMVPGIGATMVNGAIGSGLTTAGVQGLSTGVIRPGDVARNSFYGAIGAGAGSLVAGTDTFKALPEWLQPGAKAASGTLATTGDLSKAGMSFIGAELQVGGNMAAKEAAEKMGLDWGTMPQWARDSMVTAAVSSAKGNPTDRITSDVAGVMVNAAFNTVKGFVSDALPDVPAELSQYDPQSPKFNPTDFAPISKDGLRDAQDIGTIDQLQNAGMTDGYTDTMGEWPTTDNTPEPNLHRVEVTGNKPTDDLTPLTPGDLNPGVPVAPGPVLPPTQPLPEQPNVTPDGTDKSTTPKTNPTPTPTPKGTQAGMPHETWGVHKGQGYDPYAWLRELRQFEEKAQQEDDDPLKWMNDAGFAKGGAVDDLLQYLRK